MTSRFAWLTRGAPHCAPSTVSGHGWGAARRSPSARAPSTVYGHGWGAARRSPLAGAGSPRRADAAGPGCSRRRLLLFRPQALLAAWCCLVLPSPPRGVAIVVDWGTRLRLPPAHIFVPGRRALELVLPLHWMVWRADAAPGRTLGQC